jgi:hypothetical protein
MIVKETDGPVANERKAFERKFSAKKKERKAIQRKNFP